MAMKGQEILMQAAMEKLMPPETMEFIKAIPKIIQGVADRQKSIDESLQRIEAIVAENNKLLIALTPGYTPDELLPSFAGSIEEKIQAG